MKFIKKYEELNLVTYKNAAAKLREHGQTKRSNKLLRNAIGEFDINLELHKYTEYSKDDIKYSQSFKASFYDYKIIYGENEVDTIEELAKEESKDFYVQFYFIVEIEGKEYTISPFDIDFVLSDSTDNGISIEFITPSDITSITFKGNEYGVGSGIFTNRQSAGRFKNKVLLPILEDPRFAISDLISLAGGETSQLIEFENAVKNINPNLICGDSAISKMAQQIKLY